LRTYLDLVALGTVADMVPLQDENRVLTRYGLLEANRTAHPGLRALKEVAGITTDLDAYHIGFLLGPRLNAAGRLGTALRALDLLLSREPDHVGGIAAELDAANRERQQVETGMVEEAVAAIDAWFDGEQHYGIVAARREWHPGVIGIVASRLCARYSRPVIVIAVDEEGIGRGSCRSISSFNMVEGLADCADLLQRYGGHQMAAGLQVEERHIDALRDRFNVAVRARVKKEELRPEQRIDAWISLREADWKLWECQERMAPFGLGNPKPVWGVKGARLLGAPRVVGEKHLKMTVLEGNTKLDAIAFNMADRAIPDGPLDFAFQLSRNTWMDRDTLQMNVQDFRPATE
jgi:single-stranded-DNA-specific exonuclease